MQVKIWLDSNLQTNQMYSSGLDDDYTNSRSLLGGDNSIPFNPYNIAQTVTVRYV